MRAVVYRAPEKFGVEEVPDRPLGPAEVRVRNEVVGVCGTDNHIHHGGFGVRFPLTPGHEIAGRVVELGPEAVGVRVGQFVAVDNTVHCLSCANCKRGRFSLCLNFDALGVTGPGGFAEHTIAAAAKCYPIDGLSSDQAQKLTAKPTVARVRAMPRPAAAVRGQPISFAAAVSTARMLA